MLQQIGIIYIIAAAYLLLSLILMMTRKYRLRILTMLPPICQVASLLALKQNLYPAALTERLPAPLLVPLIFLVNLLILLLVSTVEQRQMTEAVPAGPAVRRRQEQPAPRRKARENTFDVDTDLLSAAASAPASTPPKQSAAFPADDLPDLMSTNKAVLTRPEAENKPVNVVLPVQQEVFEASQGEVEEMIDNMVASGDMANAKRYLRMLAFFAKDEATRKIAEKKLAEIGSKAN